MDASYDIVVAGSGLCGLTAGLTAARLGRKTLILTGDVLGGQLLSIETVDGYPGFPEGVPGFDLCPMAQEQAMAAGAEIAMTEARALEPAGSGWTLTTGDGDVAAKAVIVATGTSLAPLGVPGEERLRGKGVSQCASCDAPLLRGKAAAIVGGGDSAVQEALTLAAAAGSVVIVHRGKEFTAQAAYRERIASLANVTVRFETMVEEILGEDGLTGIRIRDATGATEDLPIEGFFAYVGLRPNTDFVRDLLRLDAAGRILTDEYFRTSAAGVYAAGSVRSGAAIRAAAVAGEGAAAAIAASSQAGGCDG